jgi:hypothetical protein
MLAKTPLIGVTTGDTIQVMGSKRNDTEINFLPHTIRDDYREKQIDAIRAEVQKMYEERIRAAASSEAKQVLKSQCEAAIAERIEPLLQERELDTPECL